MTDTRDVVRRDAEPRAAARAHWDQDWVDAFLRCPACHHDELERHPHSVRCTACQRETPLADGGVLADPRVGSPPSAAPPRQDIAARVRTFYEQHPFPNYDGFESVGDLLARASRSVYAVMLDRQIPIGARVLEVGCGTGQLGLFLSIGGRAVVGVDLSRASLRLANRFADEHGLADCQFVHASLFDLPLGSEAFDLVICKGVLHHTPDPEGGLRAILRVLRPGGYVVCGLYNRLGRIPTTLRRAWIRATGRGHDSADVVLRELAQSTDKARSWFLDQYAHPHESRHSVDQVMRWFDRNGVDFLQCVPGLRFGASLQPHASLFAKAPPPGRWQRLLLQAAWMFTIGREGALFDMIGRKRSDCR